MQDSRSQRADEEEDELSTTGSLRAGVESRRLRGAVYARLFGDDAEPIRIDRYTVLKRIGQGGMGVVYSAYDTDLDRKVAVKLLHRTSLESATDAWRARMRREAQALARLSHPNVVAVYDVGEFDDQVFLAMEFVEGATAREWAAASDRHWRDVLDIYVQAGRGLAAAHAAEIVHRDFKPDNVLVGRDGRARVADFGLARATRAELLASTPLPAAPEEDDPAGSVSRGNTLALTPSEGILGTPAYMAPEQHLGDATDPRADQFSFCVSLYEALYGERPFGGRTRADLRRAIDGSNVRPVPRGSRVPAWLRRVVLRGLSSARENRYASMDELLVALQRDPARLARRVLGVGAVVVIAALLMTTYQTALERDAANEASQAAKAAFKAEQLEQHERAREDRDNALTLRQVRDEAASDPTRAVALLSELSERSPAWAGEARIIANDAVARGVAKHVIDLEAAVANHELVELSPGGRHLLLRPLHVGPARLVDLGDGRLPETDLAVTVEPGPVRVAFSPDDATVAVVAGERVHVLDVATGTLRTSRAVDPDHVAVALSPDGAWLAVRGQGEDVQIGRTDDGAALRRLRGHVGGAVDLQIAVTPAGPRVVTVDELRTVRLWRDPISPAEVLTGVGPVAMTPDGATVAVTRANDEVWIHDLATGASVRLAEPGAPVQRIAIAPDGEKVAMATADGELRVFGREGELGPPVDVEQVEAVQFIHRGRYVIAQRTRDLLVWDLPGGRVRKLLGHHDVASWAAVGPNRVRTVGREKKARTWDLSAPAPRHDRVAEGLEYVRWLPGADGWAVVTRSGTPGFLSSSGEVRPKLSDGAIGAVSAAGTTADGKALLLGDSEGLVHRWDPGSGELVRVGDAGVPVKHVIGLRDGRIVAAGGEQIVTWDGATRTVEPTPGFWPELLGEGGERVRVLGMAGEVAAVRTLGSDDVVSVEARRAAFSAFSADASVLAIGDMDRVVRLWTAKPGDAGERGTHGEVRQLGKHVDDDVSVSISPDGDTVVVAGRSGTLRIWDVRSGAERTTRVGLTGLIGVQIGVAESRPATVPPAGYLIVTASRDGRIRLVPDPAPRDPTALRTWVEGLTDLKPASAELDAAVYVGPWEDP